MIVVLASEHDPSAHTLISNWKDHNNNSIELLTPKDLSKKGWKYRLGDLAHSTAVINGKIVNMQEIVGVLTRLPCIFENDLFDIVKEDRSYVATEMTAFMLSWLSELRCPVLNKPTPTCLSGPYLRDEQWVYAASQVGINVRALKRDSKINNNDFFRLHTQNNQQFFTVTLVGDKYFGDIDNEILVSKAKRLAHYVGIEFVSIYFDSPDQDASCFIGANIWPDINSMEIADAIYEYMQKEEERQNSNDFHFKK